MYKVLVVEDETLLRKGLIYSIPWIELECVVVGEAGNGIEGIEKIKELQPDIVITDINMPVMDGLEMIRSTSQDHVYSIIILSGYHEFEYAKQAIRYGVSEYLLKPVDHDEMKQAIANACDQIEMRRLYETQMHNAEGIKTITVLDYQVQDYKQQSQLVKDMVAYVEENYHKKFTMEDVSNQLACSITLMNMKFKKETNYTFNDFVNRYRIQMALNSMKEKKKPIYQLAIDCGFRDYKYFHIVFKKYIGCSPKEFLNTVGKL